MKIALGGHNACHAFGGGDKVITEAEALRVRAIVIPQRKQRHGQKHVADQHRREARRLSRR